MILGRKNLKTLQLGRKNLKDIQTFGKKMVKINEIKHIIDNLQKSNDNPKSYLEKR